MTVITMGGMTVVTILLRHFQIVMTVITIWSLHFVMTVITI